MWLALPAPASDLPTVNLWWRRGRLRLLTTQPFIGNKWDCQCREKTEPCSECSRHEFEKSHSETLSDSVGLVAESTGAPSNRSSAVLTEARHCITYNWPEPTTHTHTHDYTTNAF